MGKAGFKKYRGNERSAKHRKIAERTQKSLRRGKRRTPLLDELIMITVLA